MKGAKENINTKDRSEIHSWIVKAVLIKRNLSSLAWTILKENLKSVKFPINPVIVREKATIPKSAGKSRRAKIIFLKNSIIRVKNVPKKFIKVP